MDDDEVPSADIELISGLYARKTAFAVPFKPTWREYEVLLEERFPRSNTARPRLASKIIGPPVRPQDVADMSVFEAVYWIASKGGSTDFNVEDHARWIVAAETLLEKIRFGLKVTGRRSERDRPDPDGIPAEEFYGTLTIFPPYQSEQNFADKVFDDVSRIELCPAVGSRAGDMLFSGNRRPVWFDLRVSGTDVDRLWPFEEERPAQPGPEEAALVIAESAVAVPTTATGHQLDLTPSERKIYEAAMQIWGELPGPRLTKAEFRQQIGIEISKFKDANPPSESVFKRFWRKVQRGSADRD